MPTYRKSGVATLLSAAALQNPGQPTRKGTPLTFEQVGTSGVSAQQMFLGTANTVYILDKAENNPEQIGGHPAWATEYHLGTDKYRTMDVITNTFCAGGNVLGNGTWMNVGGNNAVGSQGVPLPDDQQNTGSGPYQDHDGGFALRFLDPCDDQSCEWVMNKDLFLPTRRWYPTLETLEDGRMIIIGGDQYGGYVSAPGNNNPSYTFYPDTDKVGDVWLGLLNETMPANLFPLTWLLPSGNLLIQSNYRAIVLDYKKAISKDLPDIPAAVRTYPASAGTVMLPLTPANKYNATILFCGGNDRTDWTKSAALVEMPASDSCVRITPDISNEWETDDPLREGRTMGSMIILPTGKVFMVNGANLGTAGYADPGETFAAGGQSLADKPLTKPLLYDPDAPAGSRWQNEGLGQSTINRMYHSSAILLVDGSVMISGSNPNVDVVAPGPGIYHTEYAVELWYPPYYNKRRPEPKGLPTTLSYGGAPFDFTLSLEDFGGNAKVVQTVKVVVIRPGFSTHALNMGQRYVQLESSYTVDQSGNAIIHSSQLPPIPGVIAPGPAYLFIVVDDVPSVGVPVMLGSGVLGAQPLADPGALPQSTIADGAPQKALPQTTKNAASARVAWSAYATIVGVFASIVATI